MAENNLAPSNGSRFQPSLNGRERRPAGCWRACRPALRVRSRSAAEEERGEEGGVADAAGEGRGKSPSTGDTPSAFTTSHSSAAARCNSKDRSGMHNKMAY